MTLAERYSELFEMNLLRIEEGEAFTSKRTLTQVDWASHQSLSNGPQNISNRDGWLLTLANVWSFFRSLDIEMPARSSFTMRCLKRFMIEYHCLKYVAISILEHSWEVL